jgi:hypothetical protein
MDSITQTILSILAGILISAFTSVITVRLALNQFYSQKWWERKANAYSAIIEALYHVQNDLGSTFDDAIGEINLSEERKKYLEEESRKGYAEIYKAENIGAFVISKEAAECLTRLRKRLDNYEDHVSKTWEENINNDFIAVRDCLEEFRIHAKRDLHVK